MLTELKEGTEIELLKPLLYRENIEELIYEEELPIGREGTYFGKRQSRTIDVHDKLHPEYINSENMWVTPQTLPGGHVILVMDKNGWECRFVLSDEKLNEYVKVKTHQTAI